MRTKKEQNTYNLSQAESVFEILKIFEDGFKPGFFTNQDLYNLSQTSKTMHKVVSGELNQRAAQKLLTHVVLGEQDKAEAMIKANNKLLYIKTSAKDYSGRTIIATPFQAAIGAGDKPMWEMMLPYFKELDKGEALRQFYDQLPEGIEGDVSAEELKLYYNDIASAIIKDDDNDLSAIERFRKEITSQNEITQGKHFNLQHLVAAYQAYIDNFDALATSVKRDTFWQKIIGYVQRQMTAYDAQVHCSGIQNETKFSRTLSLANSGEFFPLSCDSGLGFDFVVFSRCSVGGGESRVVAALVALVARKLCETKTNNLDELRESLEQGMRYQPQ